MSCRIKSDRLAFAIHPTRATDVDAMMDHPPIASRRLCACTPTIDAYNAADVRTTTDEHNGGSDRAITA
jgi:hypothetical protein